MGGTGRRLCRVARKLGTSPAAFVEGRLRPLWATLVARKLRVPLAASVLLVGGATGLVAGADSPPPEPAAEGAALVLPVGSAGRHAKPPGERRARGPRRGGAAHYRRNARKRVPPAAPERFLPLYREASRRYGVNWRLLASIHRQETAFSTASTTYHGLNAFGCCAGPMQFNVTNGPVSTWKRYRNGYRQGRRPRSYPHRTRRHPSVYDDFDAMMAAAWLLSDLGAGGSLDAGAWWAAYGYYGHDLFGVTYASQVLARAVAWQRYGFCPNCALDEGLVARFDAELGAPVRRRLLADERRKQQRKVRERRRRLQQRRRREQRKAELREQLREHRRRAAELRERARREASARPRPSIAPPARRRAPRRPQPPPPATTTPTTATTATPPPPAPAPARCSPVRKLLGC